MKAFTLFLGILFLTANVQAQKANAPVQNVTVDDILNKYFEKSGGQAKWASLANLKMTGMVKTQGMEIPMTTIQTVEGKQKVSINFQGMEITQVAFDGNQGWNTNFMTLKAEKMDTASNANMKDQAKDFPDPFLNYKEKGYMVQLEGKETFAGKETHKVKLTKKPLQLAGNVSENIFYYFFDVETYLPVAIRSTIKAGQMKGASMETLLSDYRESNGLYFPFSIATKYNGQLGEAIQLESIEQNVTVDDKIFAFPEGQ